MNRTCSNTKCFALDPVQESVDVVLLAEERLPLGLLLPGLLLPLLQLGRLHRVQRGLVPQLVDQVLNCGCQL